MSDNLDISLLMERLSAQTEVHSKYTEAFVKIISILDDIKRVAQNTEHNDAEQFRILLEKHVSVVEQLKNIVDVTREHAKHNADLIESLSGLIDGHHDEQIDHMKEQFEIFKKLLVRKDNEMSILIQRSFDLTDAISKKIIEIIEKNKLYDNQYIEQKQILDNIQKQLNLINKSLDSIHEYSSGWQSTWKQWKTYIVVAFVLIGIIETLVQLGVLHLTWGGK